VQLRPNALMEYAFPLLQNGAYVGAQLARVRVDDLKLFFDPEREGRTRDGHRLSAFALPDSNACRSSRSPADGGS
jgi:hypothetical protein